MEANDGIQIQTSLKDDLYFLIFVKKIELFFSKFDIQNNQFFDLQKKEAYMAEHLGDFLPRQVDVQRPVRVVEQTPDDGESRQRNHLCKYGSINN